MRIQKLLVAAALASVVASPSFAQTAEKYQELSEQLVAEASGAMTSEQAKEAQALYERALVANPANIDALIGLGKAHEAQGRVGSGLKYYRKALELEPNDKNALEYQALAFLKRNLRARAESNRDKLASLCTDGCKELEAVASAIEEYSARKADASLQSEG
ncbi:tetratricopeptide repeat protein [Kordiimonas sp.]|uniref:tetratricopeptide repeat protein n=1 Tax=Kordiimonas sp. TaxID=1970157 RepID=UPI003A8FADDA